MADAATCPWCAEPLPGGVERCPACGERPADAPRAPSAAGASPGAGAPAKRGSRGLLVACGLVAAGMCAILGAVVVISDRPAWYGHPEAEPLFVAQAPGAAAKPRPAPAHVRVGERWAFRDEWNVKAGATGAEELVWEVVEAGPDGVRYVVHEAGKPGPETTWMWAPLEPVSDVFTSARTKLDAGGRTFDVVEVHVREWASMMNDVQATVSVVMDGDRPAFPGVVKTVRSNQGYSKDGWTLIRVDPPATRDRPTPGR